MKKYLALILLSAFLFLGLDVSDANLMADVTFTNDTGSAITETPQLFPLSTQGLLNGNVIQSDTLDLALLSSSNDEVPMMPSPAQTEMQECRLDDGGAFSNEDSDCNDPDAGDEVSLLPATPLVDDAFYFGGHWPFRILRLQMDTPHTATGTALDLTWEYCTAANCTSATAVSNLADGSDDFRNAGTVVVSFDMPTDWAQFSVDGSTSYWLRARVTTAPTGTLQQPLADQVWWERGVAEALMCSTCGTDTSLTALTLNDNTSVQYSLYSGQSTDLTHHLYYPDPSQGFTVADAADLEPGADDLVITFNDIYTNADASGGTRHLLDKGNEFEIKWENTTGELSVDIRDDPSTLGACNLTATGISTGQHDIVVDIDKGTDCTITVDGVVEDTDNDVSGNTENNANDWVFLDDNSAVYVGLVSITVNGALEAEYELDDTFTGANLENRADPGTHDVTPTFNVPSSVIGSVGAFQSVQVIEGEASEAGSPDIVGDFDTPEFAGTPVSGTNLPGGEAVDALATAGNLPSSSFWLMLGFVASVATLAFGFKFTQNIVFSMLLAGFVMMLFSTMGFFEVWQVFVFAVVGAVIVLIGARFSLNA